MTILATKVNVHSTHSIYQAVKFDNGLYLVPSVDTADYFLLDPCDMLAPHEALVETEENEVIEFNAIDLRDIWKEYCKEFAVFGIEKKQTELFKGLVCKND